MSDARRIRLTARNIEALQPDAARFAVWDTHVPGFCIRVSPGGAKVFYFCYRMRGNRRKHWRKIAPATAITVQAARDTAADWLRDVASGRHPADIGAGAVRSVQQLCDQYLELHASAKKSAKNDRSYWRKHILPHFTPAKPVTGIDFEDCQRLHRKLKDHPTTGNRVIEVLAKALDLAMQWGWLPKADNPASQVTPYPERKRTRYIQDQEAPKLGRAIEAFVADDNVLRRGFGRLVLVLLFTGARDMEWRAAKAADLDLEGARLRLPDTKSGTEQWIDLDPVTVEILREQLADRPDQNPYIFPGAKADDYLKATGKPWRALLKDAGIKSGRDGLQLKDLRHTLATHVLDATGNLRLVQDILRHADISTTTRYSHVISAPRRQAAAAGAAVLQGMLRGQVRQLRPPKAQGGDGA